MLMLVYLYNELILSPSLYNFDFLCIEGCFAMVCHTNRLNLVYWHSCIGKCGGKYQAKNFYYNKKNWATLGFGTVAVNIKLFKIHMYSNIYK